MSRIIHARKEWLPRLTQLWQEGFQDREEEIQHFQRKLFRPEETWCCLEVKKMSDFSEVEIASVIYGIPARIWTRKGCCPAVYLYAGTTGKEYRHQGCYGKLLRMISQSVSCQEYPILVPARGLIPLYEHCGYQVLESKADAEIKEILGNVGIPDEILSSDSNILSGLQIRIREDGITGAEYKAVRDGVFLNRLSLAELDGYVEWCEQYLDYAIEEVLEAGGVAARISINSQKHVLLAHRREHMLYILDTTLSDADLSVCAGAMEEAWGVSRIIRRGFVLMGAGGAVGSEAQGRFLQNVQSLYFGISMDE